MYVKVSYNQLSFETNDTDSTSFRFDEPEMVKNALKKESKSTAIYHRYILAIPGTFLMIHLNRSE